MHDISKYFMINEISDSNIKCGLEKLVNHYNNNITIFLFNFNKSGDMKNIFKFINKYLVINYTKLISIIFNEPNCDFCNKLNDEINDTVSIIREISYKNPIPYDIINYMILDY
jgi:thioredoxin-related protein